MSFKLVRHIPTGTFYLAPGRGTTADRWAAHRYTDQEIKDRGIVQKQDAGILEIIEDVPSYSEQLPAARPLQLQADITVLDPITVGDLKSSARGTGARKSAGKPDWSQLPWWVVDGIFHTWKNKRIRERTDGVLAIINLMAEWQRGRNEALDEAAALLLEVIHAPSGHNVCDPRGDWFPVRAFESTVRVLEFGAKKYAKGNWAKGMPWSVCFTCTMSHLSKAWQGEEKDEESGLPHLAHAMCNIVFLLGYRTLYPEGDDRLPEFAPKGVAVDLRHE